MNEWLWFAAGLLLLLAPCGWVAVCGGLMEKQVAVEMAAALTCLILVALAEGFHRSIYADLALVFALMSFVSTLVTLRFLERWV